MKRVMAFSCGIGSYLVFLITALWCAGFVGNIAAPKTIDSGESGPIVQAISIDALLLGLFAIQHSVMARPGFKRWWTRIVPEPVERSTYNLIASVLLLLLIWQWRPIAVTVWNIESGAGNIIMHAFFWAGWAIVVGSTFLINHLDFMGLRQVYLYLRGRPYAPLEFKTPALYKVVRHPIMLGFIIAFWSAPHMTAGHLLFAAAATVYILIGIRFEEHDLAVKHGASYEEYRQRVPMILPLPSRNK